MQPARRTNPLSIILSVLLVIALLALAWFAWQWIQVGDRADRLDQEVTTLRQQASDAIAPSDDDATTDRGADTTTTNDSESDRILAAAQAYEKAQPANQGVELQYQIAKREGDFARVDVGADVSGHALILKKVDDIWVVVASGQSEDPEAMRQFGIPRSIIE